MKKTIFLLVVLFAVAVAADPNRISLIRQTKDILPVDRGGTGSAMTECDEEGYLVGVRSGVLNCDYIFTRLNPPSIYSWEFFGQTTTTQNVSGGYVGALKTGSAAVGDVVGLESFSNLQGGTTTTAEAYYVQQYVDGIGTVAASQRGTWVDSPQVTNGAAVQHQVGSFVGDQKVAGVQQAYSYFGRGVNSPARFDGGVEVSSLTKGSVALAGDVVCFTANSTIGDCPLSTTAQLGVWSASADDSTVGVQVSGIRTLNFDSTVSPSVGWFACTSASVTGKVAVQASACAAGRQVGILAVSGSSVTSGQVFLQFK